MKKGLSLLLILLVSLLSCESKREVLIKGAPVPTPTVSTQTESDSDSFEVVDILTPEKYVETEASQDLERKDIFDLWDIFFESFVIVVSTDPYISRVDYESMHTMLSTENQEFLALLGLIESKMATTNLNHLSFEEKAAFYINAYNYTAIRLVNKGYINRKGERIDNFLKLSKGANPLEIIDRNVLPLQQGIVSLDVLENRLLKGLFSNSRPGQLLDARFHLVLNNTSVSRPSLPNQAYHPETLEEQISETVGHAFKDYTRIAVVQGDTLHLSRFFKWYREDFELDQGALGAFAKKYGTNLSSFNKVKFLNYSYDINRLTHDQQSEIEAPVLPSLQVELDEEDEEQATQGPCSELIAPGVEVIFLCRDVAQGVLGGFYDYRNEVKDAHICVYRREASSTEAQPTLGLRGHVDEYNIKEQKDQRTPIVVEGEFRFKKDKYTLRTTEAVRTKAILDLNAHTLEVRQTSRIVGKGHRKFNLSCVQTY